MAHHIYTPDARGGTVGLLVGWGKNANKPQCRESIRNANGWGFSQCSRVGTVQEKIDGEDMWFCVQHSAEKAEARRAASQAKYDAEAAARSAKWKALRDAPKYKSALKQIAAGHNDPRALAAQVLAETE